MRHYLLRFIPTFAAKFIGGLHLLLFVGSWFGDEIQLCETKIPNGRKRGSLWMSIFLRYPAFHLFDYLAMRKAYPERLYPSRNELIYDLDDKVKEKLICEF